MRHSSRTRRQRRSWCSYTCLAASLFFSANFNSSGLLIRQSRARLADSLSRDVRSSSLHSQVQSVEHELKSLTVKELRTILKSSHLNKRGVMSQLKLKSELVAFLRDNLDVDSLESIARTIGDSSNEQIKGPVSMISTTQTKIPNSGQNAKDTIFEKIYEQYPPLRNGPCTGLGEQDIRHHYHPIFAGGLSHSSGDMDLISVGTASCTPSVTRGVSCTALRLNWNSRSIHGVPGSSEESQPTFNGGTWIFDVGEATQLQIQKTPSVRPSKISKIFLTHAHGDHTFGLPGLLCLMGQDRDRHSSPPIDIYGPEGLRMWLRVAIRYSVSKIVPNYRVHELKEIPVAPEWEFSSRSNRYFYRGLQNRPDSPGWGFQGLAGEDPQSWITQCSSMALERDPRYGEVEGGRDIFPEYNHPNSSDGAPIWEVEDEAEATVRAAPMSHSIPCVGYCIEEKSKPGRLRDEVVVPMVKRNLDALKEAGFKIPMKALAVIKNLPEGSAFTFPDGTVITQEEAVEPERRGRKVVICGDTASSRAIEGLAMGADVVVHEATNSFLAGIDRDTDLREVTRDTIIHGHSTPYMAGQFAKRVGAKRLILNHFSARYKGDQTVESLSIMTRIESQAIKASGLSRHNVVASWDLMSMPIRQADKDAGNEQ